MAEYNVKINVKTDTGYDQLYPKSKSDIIDFDKTSSNLSSTNVEAAIKEVNTKANTNKTNIGTLTSLTTNSKTNLVGAINEVDSHANTAQSTANTNKTNIGTLSSLKTTIKTSIVNAINWLYDNVVRKANVIDSLDDILANQADGMVAGAKAVADLNGNVEVGDSESMNGHYVLFKDQNLLINYGTCVVKNVALNQNGQWYTGSSSNIQYGEFAKAFSHLYSLTCSMSFGDWVSIIYQRADNTGIKELAFGYGAPYSSREFRIDYVAIGRIV